MAQMSTPIYSFHGLVTRGSLNKMADHIGLVESINHLPGVCTTIYPCSTILIDRIIIENCKKIVVYEETGVGDLLSGRH